MASHTHTLKPIANMKWIKAICLPGVLSFFYSPLMHDYVWTLDDILFYFAKQQSIGKGHGSLFLLVKLSLQSFANEPL